MSGPTTAPIGRPLLAWAGLDFDTAELDLELREALAAVAPEGGALRALAAFASVRAALVALDDDLGREAVGAVCERGVCLERLDAARVQLEAANAALMRARRTLGLS